MAELKTQPTGASVRAFLDAIADADRRRDARRVHALMKRISGTPPRMWGTSIVGYGRQHLRYASGRELDWFVVGFSPRKQALTLYLFPGLSEVRPLLNRLGPHTTGQGCLYIDSLDRVDLPTLEKLIARSVTRASTPAAAPRPRARASAPATSTRRVRARATAAPKKTRSARPGRAKRKA